MIAYFDSSAIVKLVVDEDGSETAARVWDACDDAVASRLAYVEVFAALAEGRRAHRLNDRAYDLARSSWATLATSTRWVELTEQIARDAGELAAKHALSGADATHLSSALAVGADVAAFVTWDRRLATAAKSESMAIAPSLVG